jgi:hypothetical protein
MQIPCVYIPGPAPAVSVANSIAENCFNVPLSNVPVWIVPLCNVSLCNVPFWKYRYVSTKRPKIKIKNLPEYL